MQILSMAWHSGANLLREAYFEHMLKNKNGDRNVLILFPIVLFAIESVSDVKWTLKVFPVDLKKGCLRLENDLKMQILTF